MEKQDIKDLQEIVMDNMYKESTINRAIEHTDDLEVKVCLRALRNGHSTFKSRMVLQDFICKLSAHWAQ